MSTTPPQLVASCALRAEKDFVDGSIYVQTINDANHDSFGVEGVDVVNGTTIRVWHTSLDAVNASQVTADETLAKLRIVPGASAGLDYTDVTLWRDGVKLPVSSIVDPYANLWLTIYGYPLGSPS